jgi:hypothetical protein
MEVRASAHVREGKFLNNCATVAWQAIESARLGVFYLCDEAAAVWWQHQGGGMRVRVLGLLFIAAGMLAGCGGTGAPMATGSSPAMASFAGTWVGALSETGGSMMGSRGMGSMMGGPMMGRATWSLSEDGSQVNGYMDLGPFGGTGRMQMTGTVSGDRWDFTMNVPDGMMPETTCHSTASGTCRIANNVMTGTYSGMNSCAGAFGGGTLTLTHQP